LRAARPSAEGTVTAVRRRIESVERRLVLEFSEPDSNGRPTRAVATIRKRLNGTVELPDYGPRGSTKRLDDHWTRAIHLSRITHPDSAERLATPWRIDAISSVDIYSADHLMDCATCGTTAITSVRLQSDYGVDVRIESPSRTWPRDGWITIATGARIGITMEIRKDTDTPAVGYVAPKAVFSRTAIYTYFAEVTAPAEPGIYHLPLGVLDANPDSSERPFDSVAWFVPLRVAQRIDPLP
jgi:hypothetical protein